MGECTRRGFLFALGAAAVTVYGQAHAQERGMRLPAGGVMPTRTLGATGEQVSLVGLGGAHLGRPRETAEAVRIVRYAIDHGVTFMDNCWDYHRGASEERMGLALRDGYRRRAFLMTKLDGRTRASATAQLEQSLRRLQTDTIDLVQIHEVIRMEDAERVFGPGGAAEALDRARQQGKVRYVGFTGHKDPAIHMHMLRAAQRHGFRFDTVQLPLNPMDPHYRSFEREVLPTLVRDRIGVLGMKSLGSGDLLRSGAVSAPECLRYAMSLPTSVVITGCERVADVDQALRAAYGFEPMSEGEVRALLSRTARAGGNGRYELFKTSTRFDATARNPHWLETARL